MSTTATKPMIAKARGEAATLAQARNKTADQFHKISIALGHACDTDEPHEWTGESDRLLRLASDLAARLSVNAQASMEQVDAMNDAFDVAALIRAARLVPGDVESAARKAYIEEAGRIIMDLAECDLQSAIDFGVQRPAAPIKKAAADDLNKKRATLWDHVQMAESIAGMLAFSYDGESRYEEPDRAPGVRGMVAAVADLLSQASDLAFELGIRIPELDHARAFAEHLEGQSSAIDFGDGFHGFNAGAGTLSMCYWTIETLAHRAFWNNLGEHAA